MSAAPCVAPCVGYTFLKRLENAKFKRSRTPTTCLFYARNPPGFRSPVSDNRGIGGMQRPQGVALHLNAVFQPARSPAPSRVRAESAGDCSMPNRTAALQPDQATPADVDNVLNQMFSLQTDLKILTDQLARTRDLNLYDGALRHIEFVRGMMHMNTPCLIRH